MARTRILIDIRKHRGDSSFAVELVRCFCSRFSGAAEEWLVRPDQANLIPPESIIGTADEFDKSWGPRLRDRLVQGVQQGGGVIGGTSLLLSYDNSVLSHARAASTTTNPVTALHFSELFKMGVHKDPRIKQRSLFSGESDRAKLAPGAWAGPRSVDRSLFFDFSAKTLGAALTMEEAEKLAQAVLQAGHHFSKGSGLPQKDLRPRMAALDSRAARRFGDPASETLITNLVDQGLQQGWLKRFRRIPERTGTETLYLVENVPSPSPDTTNAHDLVRAISQGSEVSTTSDKQADLQPLGARAEEASGCKGKKHPNRATEFEAILSKARIGSMPESRERLFECVAGILTENKGALPLLELFRRAVARAQESAERDGYSAEKNWPVVQMCLRRLMLRSNVLLDSEGQPICDKIGSNAKEVASLAPDFCRMCEAYLIEHILENSGGVNYDDETYYLGLTVYRHGKERALPADELKAKADTILSFLEENGRIYMDAERILRIKPPRTRALAVAR